MYVHSYKINNSYIVYVPCERNNAKKTSNYYTRNCVQEKKKLAERTLLAPLENHSMVRHNIYGDGKVISTDVYGYMMIEFERKTVKFMYPDAFKNGFLVRI